MFNQEENRNVMIEACHVKFVQNVGICLEQVIQCGKLIRKLFRADKQDSNGQLLENKIKFLKAKDNLRNWDMQQKTVMH